MRIGFGIDGHRLAGGRKLLLGGVEVPFEKGLLGHSDGDVVLHAAIDAVLGAACLGDIGEHFPDTDPKYKDASSAKLAEKAISMVESAGWNISNVDVTIVADEPKLGGAKAEIAFRMSDLFGCPVSVKAKTAEGLSAPADSISAYAVALLRKKK